MSNFRTFAAAFAGFTVFAFPAVADDPGPGGQRPVVPVTGEQIYRGICQSCHMADAKGATGAGTIPALAGNTNLQVPEYVVMMVANGRGAMPWFRDTLKPQQIANITNYVRTHFGNAYAKPITPEEVAAIVGPTKP
jgi:mono/diheme cytochrome c family protein